MGSGRAQQSQVSERPSSHVSGGLGDTWGRGVPGATWAGMGETGTGCSNELS